MNSAGFNGSPNTEMVLSFLAGDTEIIAADSESNVKLSTLALGAGAINTYGLDSRMNVAQTTIGDFVRQDSKVLTLRISNGLELKCCLATLFWTRKGWKPAYSIKPIKEEILGVVLKDDKVVGQTYTIASIQQGSIDVPVYGFVTGIKTLLIPHINESNDELSLIVVHQ